MVAQLRAGLAHIETARSLNARSPRLSAMAAKVHVDIVHLGKREKYVSQGHIFNSTRPTLADRRTNTSY